MFQVRHQIRTSVSLLVPNKGAPRASGGLVELTFSLLRLGLLTDPFQHGAECWLRPYDISKVPMQGACHCLNKLELVDPNVVMV